MRLAGALVAPLGRKTVHRGRLGFIRAATRPCTALQDVRVFHLWSTNPVSAKLCVGGLRRE